MIFHFLIVESVVNVSKLETDSTIVKRQLKSNTFLYVFVLISKIYPSLHTIYLLIIIEINLLSITNDNHLN